jgi:hypothetical protein
VGLVVILMAMTYNTTYNSNRQYLVGGTAFSDFSELAIT